MAGVVGLGLDLCPIVRIGRAMQKPRFVARVFTPGERARIENAGAGAASTAAGYFAAKEAVAKALGTGFDGFSFDSVEIEPDARGCPTCVLHGRALKRMRSLGGARVMLSITHDAGMAAAVAIILA